MSTRGTLLYYDFKLFDIHFYDETREHNFNIGYYPKLAISILNREIIDVSISKELMSTIKRIAKRMEKIVPETPWMIPLNGMDGQRQINAEK